MTRDIESIEPEDEGKQKETGDFFNLGISAQGIIETIEVPCFLTDTDGIFQAGNRAYYNLTASDRNHYSGRDPYEILAPDQAKRLRSIDISLLEHGESISHEVEIVGHSGNSKSVVLKKSVLIDDDGESYGILVAIMEISELAAVKTALHASESEKQAILDGFTGILCLFDVDERLIWANDKILELHDDPVGKTCHQIFCRKEKSCNSCAVPLSLESGTVKTTIKQFEMITFSGEERVYELTGTPVKNIKGDIISVVVIGRDVTEHNRLEHQLRHTQKMEAIGTLAGGIAHDFNNILTPIMGYSEIIKLKLSQSEGHDEVILEYLDGILKAAKRAKSLVEQILTFSRSSEQKESPQYIHPIVKEVMKLMRVTLPSTITISEQVNQNCGRVSVDPTKVHQILINLCTNSSHAMEGKHGDLTVSLASTGKDSDGIEWLKLSVADTGCGIEPEVQQRIFEPYFTTKEKTRGTGMGLAMVHGIVSRMGGRIDLQSEVGEGATFNVFLPVSNAPSRLDQIIDTSDLCRGSGRILIVDDEAQVVKVTCELLSSLGYDVTGRTSPRDALALVAAEPDNYDLVLTDQTMPGLTGIELARELKKIRCNLPVVMFTGYSDNFTPQDAKEAGIDEYCMKPVSLRKLSSLIYDTLITGS
ncbi:PAS domain-containing sensor histidine kinase [Desulfosediminicola flagellatus]|uniref:PAS domain-containing sensor histidine kinase n=1 Tax=Desulfosediminicola flagellatus TaxID=2569541 RepID=UPI00142F1FD2|nr:PAS domain-containing sensor histidine kinase [Desulfosediminicola flagellatus]